LSPGITGQLWLITKLSEGPLGQTE